VAAQYNPCPQCGVLVHPSRPRCSSCGFVSGTAPTQALAVIPNPTGQHYSCPRCYSPIYLGQYFCSRCRLALDPVSLAAFFHGSPPNGPLYPAPAYQPLPLAAYAYDPVRSPKVVLVQEPKNVGLALLLTFLFGPLGMLYSTVPGAIVMLIVSLFVMPLTLCFGAFIVWPICMIWAALAASSANDALGSYIPG
jgi:hypothetical protein